MSEEKLKLVFSFIIVVIFIRVYIEPATAVPFVGFERATLTKHSANLFTFAYTLSSTSSNVSYIGARIVGAAAVIYLCCCFCCCTQLNSSADGKHLSASVALCCCCRCRVSDIHPQQVTAANVPAPSAIDDAIRLSIRWKMMLLSPPPPPSMGCTSLLYSTHGSDRKTYNHHIHLLCKVYTLLRLQYTHTITIAHIHLLYCTVGYVYLVTSIVAQSRKGALISING